MTTLKGAGAVPVGAAAGGSTNGFCGVLTKTAVDVPSKCDANRTSIWSPGGAAARPTRTINWPVAEP
ncbi:MAG: hypothetical protein ACK595_13500 [Planctomycetota bacterium]